MPAPQLRPAAASQVPWLMQGPLFRAGGVTVVDGIADPHTMAELCAEAQAHYALADRQVCDVVISDNCDGRGGVPPRQLSTGPGGLAQDRLYHSASLLEFLSRVCGGPIRPSGSRGLVRSSGFRLVKGSMRSSWAILSSLFSSRMLCSEKVT